MPFIAIIVVIVAIVAGVLFFMNSDTAEAPAAETEVTPTETTTLPETTQDTDTSATLPVTNEADVPLALDSEIVEDTTPAEPAPAVTETLYEDGTYVADASYFTPKRDEHDIEVTLTVTNDVVTAAAITYDGAAAKTPSHTRFDNAYQAAVVGVSLQTLNPSRVGGASLTTDAFNEAVDTIKNKAQT